MAGPERGSPRGGVTPTKGQRALSEGAHKIEAPPTDGAGTERVTDGGGRGVKRTLNEAAHKLGHWPVTQTPREDTGP